MGMISYIKEELNVIKERDPAIKTGMEVLLYSSFKAILSYRVAHKLFLNKHYFLARWVSQRAARKTGIEIHPGATIGKGLFIDHGSGVIIGETTVIGDNVTLYQGVTLGGTGKEKGKRHPTLEDNVMVSPSALTLRKMQLYRGVYPIKSIQLETTEDICEEAINLVSAKQIVEPGDIVVLTAGIPARSEGVAKEGISNMMRIAVVE